MGYIKVVYWQESSNATPITIQGLRYSIYCDVVQYCKQGDTLHYKPVFFLFMLVMCALLPVSADVTLERESQKAEGRLQHCYLFTATNLSI